ncbi:MULTISPECIES: hypothetical protein [unclassified Streptomyces]|uniref:hypothetical protein n=1 Tax=unclassified Streptomyces TaxID=2593676 RepID=UPI002E284D3C|nr:hypothetical protein [Streptomyces sp. NBC_00285]
MTQQTLSIDELLTNWGKAYRASLPQLTPEEEAQRYQESRNRLAAAICTRLDANGAVACGLCHKERPRTDAEEPYYYPSDECENAGEPWHYHRDWSKPPTEGVPTATTCSCGSSNVQDVPAGETPDGARYRCGDCGCEW